MYKKIIASISAWLLIFNLGFTNNLFTFAEENNNIEIVTDTKIDTETYIPNIDITQNFSDDIVFVVIKTQYSDLHKVWTPEDFNIPNIKSIQHLTNFKFSNIEEEKTYLNSVTYRQILQIELEDKGKDKILNFINDIKAQNLNFILSANVYNLNLDLNSTLETTTDKCNLTSMHKNTKNCFENDNIPKLWSYTKTYDKDGFEIHGNKNIKAGIIEYAVVNNDNFINYNINNRINLTHFPDNKVTPGSPATAVAGILAGKYTGVASNITLYSYAIGEQAPEYKEKNYNFYTALNDSIADAIDKKIPVINISMGAWEDDDFNNYLAENYPGILVCSAGNACTNNDDLPHYPSDYTANNIISVANCTQLKENNSKIECVSNYGNTSVDLAATADHIYSISFLQHKVDNTIDEEYTWHDKYQIKDEDTKEIIEQGYITPTLDINGNYIYEQMDSGGTSTAAPMVTGTIALLMSYNPDLYFNLYGYPISTAE